MYNQQRHCMCLSWRCRSRADSCSSTDPSRADRRPLRSSSSTVDTRGSSSSACGFRSCRWTWRCPTRGSAGSLAGRCPSPCPTWPNSPPGALQDSPQPPLAVVVSVRLPFPSSRHHLNYDDCLEDERENYPNWSVLLCMVAVHSDMHRHMNSS